MAFKLAEAFIEFASKGVQTVAIDMAKVTATATASALAVKTVDFALDRIDGGGISEVVAQTNAAAAAQRKLASDLTATSRVKSGGISGVGIPISDGSAAAATAKGLADIGVKAAESNRKTNELAASITRIKPPSFGVANFFGSIGTAASSAIGVVSSFKTMLLGAGAAAGAFSAVKMVGEAQQTAVAFEVMLGSADAAKGMLDEMRAFADQSPFTFPGVTDASRTLLQFGVAAGNVIPTIKQIGDVAAGDQQKMQGLSLAFGQMTATGRLMGQDLNQMINAGFNPLQEISRTTGESMGSLKKKMEDGGISAGMVANAFKTATSEGGKFHGMTERMSKTTLGLLSTLGDNTMSAMRTMAEPFMAGFDAAIGKVGGFIGQFTTAVGPAFSILGSEFSNFIGGLDLSFDAQGVATSLASVARTVIDGAKSIYGFVAPIVTNTVDFFVGAWESVSPALSSIWESAKSAFGPVVDIITPVIPTLLEIGAALVGIPALFAGVGAAIAFIASPVGIATAALTGLTAWLASGSDSANWFKEQVHGAFSFVGGFIKDTIDTAAFAFRNWGTLLDIAYEEAGLFVDNTIARMTALGSNIWKIGEWIGKNWWSILTDMASATSTILTNIGKYLGDFAFQVKEWLSGKGFKLKTTSLLDGFEATTESMPELDAANTTATTPELERLYKKLGDEEVENQKDIAERATKAREEASMDTFVGPQLPPGYKVPQPEPYKDPPPDSNKDSKASFLGFDALAKRMGEDSPMVKEQKRTNDLLKNGSMLSPRSVASANAALASVRETSDLTDQAAALARFNGAGFKVETAEGVGSMFQPSVINETNSVIPDDWQEQAARNATAAMDAAAIGASRMMAGESLKPNFDQQLAVLTKAVSAMQGLLDLAQHQGIKTQGGAATYA